MKAYCEITISKACYLVMNLCIDSDTTNKKANLTMKIVSRDFSTNDVDSTLSSLDDIQNLEKKYK